MGGTAAVLAALATVMTFSEHHYTSAENASGVIVAANPRLEECRRIIACAFGGILFPPEYYAVDNAGAVGPGVAGVPAVRAADWGGKGSGLPFDVRSLKYCAAGGAFDSNYSS